LGEISFLIVNIISRFLPRGWNDEDQIGMISTDFIQNSIAADINDKRQLLSEDRKLPLNIDFIRK
jgi:hypothetical protein